MPQVIAIVHYGETCSIKNADFIKFADSIVFISWEVMCLFFNTGTSSRMAVIQLINLGITQVLVKLLINLQHADTIMSEVLTQDILWILGQVIFKDDAL